MSSQEQWSNERVLEFLELYQAEPLLWNPMIRDHKNRNAVADTWQRVKTNFSMPCTINEFKKKRESLMSTYRLYYKKTKESIRLGAATSEIFRSTWFAYELMDSFLGPIYNKRKLIQ
ncbi:hypothetical protein NQ314_011993 [Rhamnusium bicolor]|uniref:MADF domain-containing protein n=1 Tax=Rhamnusium bicolor TaxID=1586634 RepID=A0AAV8XFE6_9CUCU|nr:hypothetical protein NQ314_011993 [Rhamnusium bicolor]